MQATCKLKSTEKVNSRKVYVPKCDFCIVLQKTKITQDLAATSEFQMLQNYSSCGSKKKSVILNLIIIPFGQKKCMYHFFILLIVFFF